MHRHIDALYRFFATRVQLDVAADLVQRTMLACLESRHKLDQVASFRAFLLGIARHEFIDHLRHVQRSTRANDKAEETGQLRTFTTHLAMRAEQKLLLGALRQLPLDLQLALELYYWEELGTAEVASVLEVPRGTVMSRLHRARRLLLEAIRAMEQDPALVESTLHGLETWARSLHRRAHRHERGNDSKE